MRGPRQVEFHSKVIDKEAVPVVIECTDRRIEGSIHVMINHRPSDVLNDDTDFIAVTNAKVTPHGGDASTRHSFIALSKRVIIHLHETGKSSPHP